MKRKLTVRERSLLLAGEFAALGAGAVILLVFIASTLDANLIQQGQGAAVITSVLADLANTDRNLNHVGSLTANAALTAIAQDKANDMAAKGYFAHNAPDGKTPWYWFQKEGYAFSYAGENLAVDFSDSADVEKAWMNSPTHRANLLNSKFTEVGIATAIGTYQGRQTTFVVEEFGTPAAAHAAAKTVTQSIVPASASELATATTKPAPSATTSAPQVKAASAKSVPEQASPASPVAMKPVPHASAPATTSPATGKDAPATETIARAVPAVGAAPALADKPGFMAFWDVFAASPKTTLRYAYYLFGIIILAAIVVETGIEVRKRHTKHAALAVLLIGLMAGLFLAADSLVFTDPVLADAGASITGAL